MTKDWACEAPEASRMTSMSFRMRINNRAFRLLIFAVTVEGLVSGL